jgi:hypothetical protein
MFKMRLIKSICLLFVLLAVLGLETSTAMADPTWQQVGGDLSGIPKSLFVYDGHPYVTCTDAGGKTTVAEYNGTSWQPVGNTGFSSDTVSLFVYDGIPYVAYSDEANNFKCTVMEYVDNGWTPVGMVAFTNSDAGFDSLYVYQGTPYVAYEDGINGGATVMKHTSGSWQTVGNADFSGNLARDESLCVYDGTPYVAFCDGSNSSRAAVMKYNGADWESVGNAGFSDVGTGGESLYIYNGTIYVAYRNSPMGPSIRSTMGTVMEYNGTSWASIGNFNSPCQSFFVYHGTPYAVCTDTSGKATVMEYDGTSWQTIGNPDFTIGQADQVYLFVYDGTIYLAYSSLGADLATNSVVMEYTSPPAIMTPVYAGTNVSVGGTATAGATILLSVNGTARPTVIADSSGDWTVNGLLLNAGDTVSATAQTPALESGSQTATATVVPVVLTSVTNPSYINVASGTAIGNVSLPTTVQVTLNNGSAGSADVTWNTSSYNSVTPGVYTFTGALSNLPKDAANPNNLTASVNAVVTVPSAEPIQLNINNSPLQMDVPPMIVNGRTMVPLRAIFEALGATVQWNPDNQSIVATKGNMNIRLQIGSTTALNNGSQVTLDAVPLIEGGRTLAPVRFVSEALGAQVNWVAADRQVNIITMM